MQHFPLLRTRNYVYNIHYAIHILLLCLTPQPSCLVRRAPLVFLWAAAHVWPSCGPHWKNQHYTCLPRFLARLIVLANGEEIYIFSSCNQFEHLLYILAFALPILLLLNRSLFCRACAGVVVPGVATPKEVASTNVETPASSMKR